MAGQKTRNEKVIKALLNDLTRSVNRLGWLELHDQSKNLEKFVLELEEKLLKEGMLE